MKESHPNQFMVSYENKNRNYLFNLKWDDNHLVLKQFSDDQLDIQENITPNTSEWLDFWHRMDDIKIWDWYEQYIMTCLDACLEGDEWEIHIMYDDLRIESYGANSYPSTFREFVQSLEELTGVVIEFIQD
ncbi:hypothetical protein [Methanobacterium petrolearium]|uniref:hypothetical protein n=1 Tax=Methanobacterium petrolearium TaxID=710190 RepID=UPI001AE62E83|nr:hypothetical protein [Methanobacterium petrolearium]MBP1945573.1 hypothetical protein [Methanobacterium petrolearium]BDZ71791.1 hypothetical protein GCM10025861_23080 [Methanobacterium petrolearium]